MKPDSNFPDRPTHSDFERLSKAVTANDDAMDQGVSFVETLGRFVDVESVLYLLEHRWGRVRQQGAELTDRENIFRASWIDGFAAAMRMVHDEAKVWDGQTRGRTDLPGREQG